MNKNEKKIYRLVISEEYKNQRLDQVLAKLLPEHSRMQIQKWIEANNILVNGYPVPAKTKMKGGESVLIEATIVAQSTWEPQAIPLEIVYEDEALMIINKPAGMVVHPGAGNQDRTLLNALLYHVPQLQILPRAGIIHRLDKDTSGLLVIAKTSLAYNKLTRQLKKRSLIREYQAIVYGVMISGSSIDAPIGRNPFKRKQMMITDTGKQAITHYRIAEKYRNYTRLKLRLETGRTHQIRVHLAHIHHPIVGDPTYGKSFHLTKNVSKELIDLLRQFKRQALHAFALGLVHPITNQPMRWEINLPDDMNNLIKALRKDSITQ